MSERDFGQIPEHLRPLYEAKTAHAGVLATLALIGTTKADLQPDLLSDVAFLNIVDSILSGLDECKRDHALEITGAFSKELQSTAYQLFVDPLN